MTEEEAALIAEAEMGEEARKFIESDLGKCILGMAEQEAVAAEKALGKVDPTDVKAISALQRQVWFAESFEQWLKELLSRGENAIEIFRHSKQGD